jgi:PAS domain S-box-containing protein
VKGGHRFPLLTKNRIPAATSPPRRASAIGLAVARLETSTLEAFRAVADGLPCLAWIADATGAGECFNHDFRHYTGATEETAIAWGWTTFVHPDDRAAIALEQMRCLQARTTLDCNLRFRSADGSYRWFNARARVLVRPDGSVSNWLSTLTDVHEQELAKEAGGHVVDALMKGYLSKELPTAEGLTFDTYYQPSNVLEKLGGDWYDVFTLPDGRIGFSLGDVCGHGVDAAVKMAEARQAIFVAANLVNPDPISVMHEANRVLFLNNNSVSITTALYGTVDILRRTVTYVSAGHHPPILVKSNGEALILPNHGFPLGVEKQMPPRLTTHEFEYEYGSTMVLYTDGLIEFDHEIFAGEARLLAACAEWVVLKADKAAEFIAKHVLGRSQSRDDIAVLTISFES